MKYHHVLLHVIRVEQLTHSVHGNPRWRLKGIADDGRILTFKTSGYASSGYRCNMNCLKVRDRLKVKYHETSTGALIADGWDDSHSAEGDLSTVAAFFFQWPYAGLLTGETQ